ncbi:uncharacterized protein LOC142525587 isoform X2 [Primulina tabacum]|uniref:uncharacterized protein LOC142525587 isoform X2 n=1 Tax=Primulina tabacum TaxID=48773 RepID=UPI003F592944
MIVLASLKSRLSSGGQDEVRVCLKQLLDLCEQRETHLKWLILEDYIPTLIELLCVKDPSIRNQTLQILCLLAKYNDDAKEIIAKVENAIKYIVRSLGKQIGEGKLAVALLLELSKCESVRDYVGPDHVQMAMAKTLWEMELTNHNKSSLVEDGVLDLLLLLVSHDDVEMK